MLLVVTYAVQNFFVFDTALTLWLLLAVFASTIARSDAGRGDTLRDTKVSLQVLPRIAAVFAAAVLILIWPLSIQPLRANRLLMDTYLYHVADITIEDER